MEDRNTNGESALSSGLEGDSGGGSDRRNAEDPRNDILPWRARFTLFFLALVLAISMLGLPVWSVHHYGATSGVDLWGPVMATLIGLTTMTISGIFVFMTFRIDRGTKLTAQWTAQKVAAETVRKLVKNVLGKEIANTRKSIDGVNKELTKVAGGVEEMKTDLTDAKSRIDSQFNEATGKMEAATGEMEAAAGKMEAATGEMEAATREMEEMEKKIVETKKKLVNNFDGMETKMVLGYRVAAKKSTKRSAGTAATCRYVEYGAQER